eukprot:7087438-Prymnesium_polylepis.1
MRHFTRQPQAAPLPLMGPPKVLRPLCHPKWNEETFATTFIASRMAGDAAYAAAIPTLLLSDPGCISDANAVAAWIHRWIHRPPALEAPGA